MSDPLLALRNKIAVVGVGNTRYGSFPDISDYGLGAQAFRAAIDDCGLDKNQIEAARDLGAPWWKIHRDVVIPYAKPGIASGCTMVLKPASQTGFVGSERSGLIFTRPKPTRSGRGSVRDFAPSIVRSTW